MLQATTEEQKARIEEIFGTTSIWFIDEYVEGVHIDDWVSFDKMAEIVDYLREQNDEIYDIKA